MNLLAFRFPRRAGATLSVACLALLLCAPAQAGRGARRAARPRPAAAHPTAPSAPAGAAALIVAKDPETGALVPPTAEQVLKLTAAERTGLMRTTEGLSEVRYPDGSVKVDLQGRFMEFGVARLEQGCLPRLFWADDEATLRALLARRAPLPTPALEER